MPNMSLSRRILKLFWTDLYESKVEQKLVAKVDGFILSYCCVSYFINYLDRTAFSNAYVTGMQESLGLKGNQYNVINNCLTVGYIISMPIHAILLQKIKPRYYFPINQILWAICTMSTAACKSFSSVCAVRFLLGCFESSTFSGTIYVLGFWLKRDEIGKRIGVFAASGVAGSMISGYIQTAIYNNMNGTHGLASWRWMFIIDGIVVFPLSLYGVFFFPDTPTTTKMFYFTEEELEVARNRLPPPKPNTKLDFTLIRRALFDWKLPVLSMLWVLGGAIEAISNQSVMILSMKAEGTYTVAQINQWPTAVNGVGIFSILVAAVYNDALPDHKWEFIGFIGLLQLIAASILLKWDVSLGGRLFAYYLAGTSYGGQSLYFAWANEICQGDDPLRALTVFCMNMFSSVLFCFWGTLLYPASSAPKYHKGMITSIVTSLLLVCWGILVKLLFDWQKRRDANKVDPLEFSSDHSNDEVVSKEIIPLEQKE
ncbi:hypothetical protein PSN45_001356 [Yamadazyma tenuis]|uniref:uncharacterized protein n=1 Tax=Candida tenuis TaxID=2315449 RepID=UPI00279D4EAF|nr:hypothetical protein PSN45_001356 [Yamadazyma tenuis]